ncbi:MAG: hypothetical protein M3680_32705 [Myxococcota bacterium]|nr:hypothetical protein [Myxococcota bacterium]
MPRDDDPMEAIEVELQGERAAARGEAGRRIDKALAALDDTDDAIDELATALRESLHMYDHHEALAVYAIPSYVMARVGVIKRSASGAR